jgi:choline dehydrogenase-like flavoprotein
MPNESYDVIIVGAGPGGLACARALAGSGKRVLVLEKAASLGKKICAGELTAKVLPDEDFERGRPWTRIHVGNDHSSHALDLPQQAAAILLDGGLGHARPPQRAAALAIAVGPVLADGPLRLAGGDGEAERSQRGSGGG